MPTEEENKELSKILGRLDKIYERTDGAEKAKGILNSPSSKNDLDNLFADFHEQLEAINRSFNERFRKLRLGEIEIARRGNELIIYNIYGKSIHIFYEFYFEGKENATTMSIKFYDGKIQFLQDRYLQPKQAMEKEVVYKVGLTPEHNFTWMLDAPNSNSKIINDIYSWIISIIENKTEK